MPGANDPASGRVASTDALVAPLLASARDGVVRADGHAAPTSMSHPQVRAAYAALDLGTNNCRLLVAVAESEGFKVIDAFSRIVRLGEGLSLSGRLSEAAMARAIDALKVCRDKMEARRVARARLIATEACRAAANGAEFLDRVRREVGIELEIVDRGTEARLAVSGCAPLVAPDAEGVVLFDIGGGSTELAWLDFAGRRSGEGHGRAIRAWTSLPFGVVTLSERFGGIHVDHAVFEAMVDDVAAHVKSFEAASAIAARVAAGRVHLLGTSGTVTTLAGLHLGLKRYDRRRVDGLWMDEDAVDGLIDQLLAMDYAERVASPCIGAERADLVLAGCAILEAIRRAWPCRRLRVADRGLREGILVTLMAEDRGRSDDLKSKTRRRRRRRGGRKRAQARSLQL